MAGLLWWALRPPQPVLPASQKTQAIASDYRAGGSTCDPNRLRTLIGPEAIVEADRCKESAEEHRLKSNDLIQQTRAADAASAAVGLGYNQTLVALAGTLVGFFTLAAAVLAAYYAKKAAEAAEKSILHSRDTAQQELRPYINLEHEKVSRSSEGDRPFDIFFRLNNVGSTPAKKMTVNVECLFRYDNGGKKGLSKYEFAALTLNSGATYDIEQTATLERDENRAFKEQKGHICIRVEAAFADDFGDIWIFRQQMSINKTSLSKGMIYTNHCEHIKAEAVQTAEPAQPKPRLRLPFRQPKTE